MWDWFIQLLTDILTWLAGAVGDWGLAIIVLTIAFRLILGSGHQALVIGLASLVGSIVSAGFMTLAYVFIARLYVAAAGVPVVEAAEVTEDGSPTL